jgi:hypothetical protein
MNIIIIYVELLILYLASYYIDATLIKEPPFRAIWRQGRGKFDFSYPEPHENKNAG